MKIRIFVALVIRFGNIIEENGVEEERRRKHNGEDGGRKNGKKGGSLIQIELLSRQGSLELGKN